MTLVNRQLLKNFSQLHEETKNSIHDLSVSLQDDSHENALDMLHLFKAYDELFYSLQDILTSDYKSQVISQLKSIIHPLKSLQIGVHILKTQNVEKPVLASNIVSSIIETHHRCNS